MANYDMRADGIPMFCSVPSISPLGTGNGNFVRSSDITILITSVLRLETFSFNHQATDVLDRKSRMPGHVV